MDFQASHAIIATLEVNDRLSINDHLCNLPLFIRDASPLDHSEGLSGAPVSNRYVQ